MHTAFSGDYRVHIFTDRGSESHTVKLVNVKLRPITSGEKQQKKQQKGPLSSRILVLNAHLRQEIGIVKGHFAQAIISTGGAAMPRGVHIGLEDQ